jgi:hypothetical protein
VAQDRRKGTFAIFTAMSRKSYWHLSGTLATQTGMAKKWLKGLSSSEGCYRNGREKGNIIKQYEVSGRDTPICGASRVGKIAPS